MADTDILLETILNICMSLFITNQIIFKVGYFQGYYVHFM